MLKLATLKVTHTEPATTTIRVAGSARQLTPSHGRPI